MNDQKKLYDLNDLEVQIKNILTQKITHGLSRSLRSLLKEVIVYSHFVEGEKKWEENKRQFNTEKIQIGGGSHILQGFLNVDIVPPADLIWDVREGLPFEDNCSKFIFSEHFLEHIDYPSSVKKIIAEFFRILKGGGRIVIGVPDSQLILEKYNEKDEDYYKAFLEHWYLKRDCLKDINTYIDLVNYHFRDQDDNEKYNSHYWAYDFEKEKSLLKNVGFKQIEKWKFDEVIANPKREWGSLYVTATK